MERLTTFQSWITEQRRGVQQGTAWWALTPWVKIAGKYMVVVQAGLLGPSVANNSIANPVLQDRCGRQRPQV